MNENSGNGSWHDTRWTTDVPWTRIDLVLPSQIDLRPAVVAVRAEGEGVADAAAASDAGSFSRGSRQILVGATVEGG